MSAKYKIKVNY